MTRRKDKVENANKESHKHEAFYSLRNLVFTDKEKAKELILKNPSVLDERNSIDETALHWYVIENCLPEIEFLLSCGADADTVDHAKSTPLINASQLGHKNVVTILISEGVNINAFNTEGDTALHLASSGGYVDIIQELLSNGADMFKRNNLDELPENQALTRKRSEVESIFENQRNNQLEQASDNNTEPPP